MEHNYNGMKDPAKIENHRKVSNYLNEARIKRELADETNSINGQHGSAVKDPELRKLLNDPNMTEQERMLAVKRRAGIMEEQARLQERKL